MLIYITRETLNYIRKMKENGQMIRVLNLSNSGFFKSKPNLLEITLGFPALILIFREGRVKRKF